MQALWPNRLPAAADTALSALLAKLRAALGPGTVAGKHDIRLVLPPDAWIDLEAASEGLHRAASGVAQGDWARAWGPSRVALHVAQRGFLPGYEAPWIDEIRRQVDDILVRAHECVAAIGLGLVGSELPSAERSARALIKLAPYRESGHRFLMEVLAQQGNSAEALLTYERLRQLLREELGASPGPATQALHKRLLQGDVPRPGDLVREIRTVLFTDIVGSTERAARVGDRGWRELLLQHHVVVRGAIERFGGCEIDTAGDGFFITFDSPARAVTCGCEIIDRVAELGITVRAGVHTGECEVSAAGLSGIALHVGARISASASPGTLLASSTVKDLMVGSGIQFLDRGTQALRGVPGEWRLFEVAPESIPKSPGPASG